MISATIFLCVFFFFFSTTKFNLTEIQLSYWGANNEYSWLWNIALIIVSISFYFNFKHYIASNHRIKVNKITNLLFYTIFISLFFTATIDMTYILHNFFAYIYFFSYPLAIFLLAHFNSNNLLYNEWLTHLIFSLAIIVTPLSLIPFYKGFAYPEIIHSFFIMLWNGWIAKNIND